MCCALSLHLPMAFSFYSVVSPSSMDMVSSTSYSYWDVWKSASRYCCPYPVVYSIRLYLESNGLKIPIYRLFISLTNNSMFLDICCLSPVWRIFACAWSHMGGQVSSLSFLLNSGESLWGIMRWGNVLFIFNYALCVVQLSSYHWHLLEHVEGSSRSLVTDRFVPVSFHAQL